MRCWTYNDDEYMDQEPVKCNECEETQSNLEGAQLEFEKLAKILYSNEHVNVWALDDAMQELAGYLGTKIAPKHLPPVVRMNQLGQELYNITSDKVKGLS